MKKLIKIMAVILVILVVLLTIGYFNSGKIVTTAINTMGPKVAGTEVSVDGFNLNLFTGKAELTGLLVGNPEGYKTENAIKLKNVLIDFKTTSLLSDTIVINKILVDAPKITLEQNITGGSNLKTIGENAAGGKEKAAEKKAKAKEKKAEEKAKEKADAKEGKEAKPGKKIVIEQFLLTDGKIKVSVAGMQGFGATIPLPTLEIKEIGKEKGGASLTEVIQKILSSIINATTSAVTGAGGFAADKVKDVGGLLSGVAKGIVGADKAEKDKETEEKIKEVEEDLQEGLDEAVNTIKNLLGN